MIGGIGLIFMFRIISLSFDIGFIFNNVCLYIFIIVGIYSLLIFVRNDIDF